MNSGRISTANRITLRAIRNSSTAGGAGVQKLSPPVKSVKADKLTIRYLGFELLAGGGRKLNFSIAQGTEDLQTVCVEAHRDLFSGPVHMAIQECAGICCETIRRCIGSEDRLPTRLQLTAADVSEFRDSHKNLRISRIRTH